MTSTSSLIEGLISYDVADWVVTEKEQIAVATLLQGDTNLDATIADLEAGGNLERMAARVNYPQPCRKIVEILGSRLVSQRAIARRRYQAANGSNLVLRTPSIWFGGTALSVFDVCGDLAQSGRRLGFLPAASTCASPASFALSSNASAPFTGVGASGTNPTTRSIPLLDQLALAAGHKATRDRYSNPIPGSLGVYLSGLTPSQRLDQAKRLVCQPVSTVFPHSYPRFPPSRTQILRAAGDLHRLQPQLLAAFVLAEQRDQSRREDAADYLGAISVLNGNTSIGLGQVLVSTAQKHDLFADLLSAPVRTNLVRSKVAALLASDEFNIFAVARYIRLIADIASTKSIAALPNTKRVFPGIDFAAYARRSSLWPDDNVKALAAEYTSLPWDDQLYTAWARFVHQGFSTIRTGGLRF